MDNIMQTLGSILPIVVLFAIFYFLIIRPQQKQQKEHKAMLASLQKGDKVLTAGGIYAEIVKVEEGFFMIRINGDTIVKLSKDFIISKLEK